MATRLISIGWYIETSSGPVNCLNTRATNETRQMDIKPQAARIGRVHRHAMLSVQHANHHPSSSDRLTSMEATERLLEEGPQLVLEAERNGLTARLIGGVGIRLLMGEQFDPLFARPLHDIDLYTRKRDSRKLEDLIKEHAGSRPASSTR